MTPFEIACGKKPDLSNLTIFGSRMYALEISKQDGKQTVDHAVPGNFLGYGGNKKISSFTRVTLLEKFAGLDMLLLMNPI